MEEIEAVLSLFSVFGVCSFCLCVVLVPSVHFFSFIFFSVLVPFSFVFLFWSSALVPELSARLWCLSFIPPICGSVAARD